MKLKMMIWAAAGLLAMGCSSEESEETVMNNEQTAEQTVTMTFSPYEQTAMSRGVTSISTVVTRLDVWITDGENTTEVHQSSSDTGFGSLSVTLNKTKTYTLYAVGHKSGGAATLTDGIISFPDNKVTHSMYYTTTFSPATTTELSCLMTRIVAQFQFNTTDACPQGVAKIRFTVGSVFDQWSVTTGGTHSLDRTSTFNNFTKHDDGTVTFNLYNITTDAQTLHSVTVEALNANDEVVQSRVFENVPLRNGYKTTYTGVYFTDTPATAAFTVGDWNEYEEVTF